MRAHRLLIPLAALLAIVPLLLHGPSCGHDFDFHLLNWLEAFHQIASGHYPRWAYVPAYHAGEPRFLFYPPLSWLLGAALTAVLPFRFTPAAYTFVCLTLSGFTFHRLARLWTGESAATLGAVFYLLNPYSLFTTYERTAYAELLAAALIPLLFAAILRPRPTATGIAIPVALLWLTNAPAAVMSTYALALLALIRLCWPGNSDGNRVILSGARSAQSKDPDVLAPAMVAQTTQPETFVNLFRPAPRALVTVRTQPAQLARTTIFGIVLGLATPAFYLIPAAYERRWVTIDMAVVEGLRPADNFLFHRTPDAAHDAVLYTASMVAVVLLTLAMAALPAAYVAARSRQTGDRFDTPYLLPALALLILAIGFLLTPYSAALWKYLPDLAFLQFPWRTLALLACAVALLAALALHNLALRRLTRGISTLLLAGVLIFHPSPHPDPDLNGFARLTTPEFTQGCEPEEAPVGRQQVIPALNNTEPTDEYTPADADNDALHPGDPPFWTVPLGSPLDQPAPASLDAGLVAGSAPGGAPDHLTLNLAQPAHLVLNRRWYPAWQIRLNGKLAQLTEPQRQDGLIALTVPAGRNTIDLTFGRTRDRLLGDLLSLAAMAVLLTILLRKRFETHKLGTHN